LTKKPSKKLLILNKLLNRLEGCLDEIKQIKLINSRQRFLAPKISTECAKTGLRGKRLIAQILEEMIMAAEYKVKDSQTNETTRTLCRLRIKFYHNLIKSDLHLSGTLLEHPKLNRAIKRIKSYTDDEMAKNKIGEPIHAKEKPRAAA
jgi:hypothetical protein